MIRLKYLCVAFTLAMVGSAGVSYLAAQSAPMVHPADHQQMAQPAAADAAAGEAQMAMHQKMMADMTAMNGRLDALVARMNEATGDAKVAAIAETVTALVEQHQSMHAGMMEMMMQMHSSGSRPMGGMMRP